MSKPISSILVASARLAALTFALAVLVFLVVTAQRQATMAAPAPEVPSAILSPPSGEVPARAPAEFPAQYSQPFLYSSKSLVVDPAVVETLFAPGSRAATTQHADGSGASPSAQPAAEHSVEPTFLPSSKARTIGATVRPLLTPKVGERAGAPNQDPR